jgi:4-hydroxybutyryl-CoA dehydratase/vinylacetyl-CoA-Delta-isomerase
MKTKEEYKESLRGLRANVYKFGELIEDVTTHPATRRTVEGHGRIYEASLDREYAEMMTTTSHLTGERISRYLSILRKPEDMFANSRMKRFVFNLTGTCTGGRCVGWTGLNSMWAVTYDIDEKHGTDYHTRLMDWLRRAQSEDIAVCGALTDPKGDRTLPPSKQADPDMYLRVVERRDDGIIVRGAKVMIAGAAAANEIFVLPGSRYGAEDADYAISFVVPRDAEGLTIVEARHPSDLRDLEEGFDVPSNAGGITQGYLFFEDVFVPRERVFMCGECDFTLPAVMNFIMPYRSAIGACVAGQGDVMVGAAMLVGRANGLADKVFRDKVVNMCINNEVTFGLGIAAAAMGRQHSSGSWICDPLLANVNKVLVAKLPCDTRNIAQDICGGIGETGCMPSWRDFQSEEYGELVRKYLKAASDAETRVRGARLVEWLTVGAGIPGCHHGGGSPDGAKLVIWANAGIDEKVAMARRLAGIEMKGEDRGGKREGTTTRRQA